MKQVTLKVYIPTHDEMDFKFVSYLLIIQKLLTLMLETGQSFLANLNAKYDTWNISGLRSGSGSSMNPTRINQNVKKFLNTEAIRGTLKRYILLF